MQGEDRLTCENLESKFCATPRNRGSNRSMCRYFGFRAPAIGVAEGAPETYADDAEVFSDEDADEYDLIIEDIEEELEHEGFDEDADGDSIDGNVQTQ